MHKTLHRGFASLEKAYGRNDRNAVLKLTNRLKEYLSWLGKNLNFLDHYLAKHTLPEIHINLRNALPHIIKDVTLLFNNVNAVFVLLEQHKRPIGDEEVAKAMEVSMLQFSQFKNTFPKEDDHLDRIIKIVEKLISDLGDDLRRLKKERELLKEAMVAL